MSCSTTQLTLTDFGRDLLEKTRSLDLLRLAAWHAFELATIARSPISTSPTLTQALLEILEDSGVLISSFHGGAHRALFDPISWDYHRSWSAPCQVEPAVRHALIARAQDPSSTRSKLHLWKCLADAEAENYLAHLIRKNGLKITDVSWIIDSAGDQWNKHSLARKRYIVWVATRTVAEHRTGDIQERAVANEVRLRSDWLANRVSIGRVTKSEYRFVPDAPLRVPTLIKTMQDHILPLGDKYWTEVPEEFLELHLGD